MAILERVDKFYFLCIQLSSRHRSNWISIEIHASIIITIMSISIKSNWDVVELLPSRTLIPPLHVAAISRIKMLQTIQKNWDKLQVGYFSQKNFRGPQTPHFVDTDLSKFSLRNWKTNLPKFLVILGWISFRESEFLGKISLELIFENWSKIVFRGSDRYF